MAALGGGAVSCERGTPVAEPQWSTFTIRRRVRSDSDPIIMPPLATYGYVDHK